MYFDKTQREREREREREGSCGFRSRIGCESKSDACVGEGEKRDETDR